MQCDGLCAGHCGLRMASDDESIDLTRREFAEIPVIDLQQPHEELVPALAQACEHPVRKPSVISSDPHFDALLTAPGSVDTGRHGSYHI